MQKKGHVFHHDVSEYTSRPSSSHQPISVGFKHQISTKPCHCNINECFGHAHGTTLTQAPFYIMIQIHR